MSGHVLLACAAFYAFGAASASLAFVIMRETLIERAVDRREREIYGPLLQRVEAQENRARERRQAVTRAIRVGSPAHISLEQFPIPRQRNHIRVR